MVKLLLQLFVGVVYAKLFEAVDFERFEPIDVEHSDEPERKKLFNFSPTTSSEPVGSLISRPVVNGGKLAVFRVFCHPFCPNVGYGAGT